MCIRDSSPALLTGLTSVHGRLVSAKEVFDAIVALLSAPSYTRRFAWDLEETFAHIPFPAQADVFAEAVRVGSEIRLLETFARQPVEEFHQARMAGHATGVTLAVPPVGRAFLADGRGSGAVALQEDQSLRLVGVPEPVWHFAVSGYRVLPHWLAARNGEALNREFNHALLDVAWRIAELLHWFDSADQVLSRAVDAPLSIADLGLPLTGADRANAVEEPGDESSDSTG